MANYTKDQLLKKRRQSQSRTLTEKEVQSGINSDPDAFEITQEMIDSGKVNIRRGRGKQISPTKVQKTVRLDSEVLEYFEADKSGWQVRLSDALKQYMIEHPRQ